jgi:hypothetical protein
VIPINTPPNLEQYNFSSKTSSSGKRVYEVSLGVLYPSVTTVLGTANVEKQAGLERWRAAVGKKHAAQVTEAACDRGTAVHETLDVWLDNTDIEIELGDQPKEIAVPVRQIRALLKAHLSEIILKENCLVSHTLKTAGRTDLLGIWKNKLAFIDFKTANKVKGEDDIRDYFLQATVYALCWYEMTGILVEDIVIIIGNQNSFKPQVFERKIHPYIKIVQNIFTLFHESKAQHVNN